MCQGIATGLKLFIIMFSLIRACQKNHCDPAMVLKGSPFGAVTGGKFEISDGFCGEVQREAAKPQRRKNKKGDSL